MTACLLNIDLFNDCLQHIAPERVERLIANVNDLAAGFRKASLPIIWVRQEFSPDLSDAFLEMRKRGIRTSITGTRGAELDSRLAIDPAEEVIVKKRYSAFFGTPLDDVLKASNVTELVLTGVNTHACIRTTAIDAYQRDFEVVLASDCLESYDEEHAEISLRYMEDKIASLESAATIAARISGNC